MSKVINHLQEAADYGRSRCFCAVPFQECFGGNYGDDGEERPLVLIDLRTGMEYEDRGNLACLRKSSEEKLKRLRMLFDK